MITNIIISVDVECALPGNLKSAELLPVGVERRVYCNNSKESYGIEFLMRTLDDYNMKGVFFCDSAMRYLTSEDTAAKVITDIDRQGHDVQLHLHPIYKLWKTNGLGGKILFENWSDNIGELPIEIQDNFIQEGVEFIKKYINKSPIAFRAGNYGANLDTLNVLKKYNFKFDSSYNLWARQQKKYNNQSITNDIKNTPFIVNGIIEVPVTNYIAGFNKAYRFFAPEGASSLEMITALKYLHSINIEYVVIVLHSFSFAKNTKDVTKEVRFNSVAYNRFINTLDFIAKEKDKYRVRTFSELDCNDMQLISNVNKNEFVSVPLLYTFGRYFGQLQQKYL